MEFGHVTPLCIVRGKWMNVCVCGGGGVNPCIETFTVSVTLRVYFRMVTAFNSSMSLSPVKFISLSS
jgi:hypothetical protein